MLGDRAARGCSELPGGRERGPPRERGTHGLPRWSMMDDAISSQTLSNPRTFPLNLHVSHSDLKKSMIVDYSDEKNFKMFWPE